MGMRPVCFLSDFGFADDFVGTCKGVMLGIAPGLSIVDLTHDVPGFGIEPGAETLQHATRYMPSDTVYLAVVDPGVGTDRRGLALRTNSNAFLVGPDNGLLIPAAEALEQHGGGERRHQRRALLPHVLAAHDRRAVRRRPREPAGAAARRPRASPD